MILSSFHNYRYSKFLKKFIINSSKRLEKADNDFSNSERTNETALSFVPSTNSSLTKSGASLRERRLCRGEAPFPQQNPLASFWSFNKTELHHKPLSSAEVAGLDQKLPDPDFTKQETNTETFDKIRQELKILSRFTPRDLSQASIASIQILKNGTSQNPYLFDSLYLTYKSPQELSRTGWKRQSSTGDILTPGPGPVLALHSYSSSSKKVTEWVCYSQSQYSLASASGKPVEPSGIRENLSSTQREKNTEQGEKINDLNALSGAPSPLMSKTLFEKQNILQCYKERNFLRLFISFCFYDLEEKNRGTASRVISPFNLKGFRFMAKPRDKKQNIFLSSALSLGNKFNRKVQRMSFQLNSLTPAGLSSKLTLFQFFIIPYTFLFGVFYTLNGFSVSSTKTAKDFGFYEVQNQIAQSEVAKTKVHKWTAAGSQNSVLYSYSIQYHSFPYEFLRLSHFSSKLFILWGILTIWKGVRPSKSTRNEYIIQTRLLTPRKNKKRFSDVEGIEKFLHGGPSASPVLKTLVESFHTGLGGWHFKLGLSANLPFSTLGNKGAFSGGGASEGARSGSSPGPFFQNYKRPKGYLFIGPPGTGKTLLAQAVAGEAGVNLVCLSASEIQKQIDIGTRIGAIRLRNLFEQAKKNTPCILFLDEIDAIGRARNESMDLKLFTEFLIQMDNFSPKDGFLVIGTTNFLSSLDSAFVRSGRFDRIIGLNYPGKQTRIAILKLYAQKGKNIFDKAIQWDSFGEKTKGLSAADLAKVVNESSLYLIQSNYLAQSFTDLGTTTHQSKNSSQGRATLQKTAVAPTPSLLESTRAEERQGQGQGQGLHSRQKKLMHTKESLERGILRIASASKNSKFLES